MSLNVASLKVIVSSRQVSLLREGRISLLLHIPAPHLTHIPPLAPIWGDFNEVAEAECTAPIPLSPPGQRR
jgi:hypothetical protein